jgi:hypothetical protein
MVQQQNLNLIDTVLGADGTVKESFKEKDARQKKKVELACLRAIVLQDRADEKEHVKTQEYNKRQELIEQGYIFMPRKQLKKYEDVMDDDFLADFLAAKSRDLIPILPSNLEAMEENLSKKREYERRLKRCICFEKKGIAYEKDGEINLAVEAYARNLFSGFPSPYSYNRLMVIYRRSKMYEDEIWVIERALEVFEGESNYKNDVAKWQKRLEKAKKLKNAE